MVDGACSYFVFTLGCVCYVELFRTRFSHKTEHPTRDFFYFIAPLAIRFVSFLYILTAWWVLIAHEPGFWHRDAHVRHPQNRGSLIVVLNPHVPLWQYSVLSRPPIVGVFVIALPLMPLIFWDRKWEAKIKSSTTPLSLWNGGKCIVSFFLHTKKHKKKLNIWFLFWWRVTF